MSSETSNLKELLFDVMEVEADVRVYADRPGEGFTAERAAIIIASGPWNYPAKGARYTLYFGRGLAHWTFKTFRDASRKALEIMAKGEPGIEYRIEGRKAKAFERLRG
jgi:hypothetical protein